MRTRTWLVALLCWSCAASALAQEVVQTETAPGVEVQAETAPPMPSAEMEARQAFDLARRAFDEGRFGEALHQFRRSYELSGRAALLYNIGLAADRLRHDREALAAFESFLDADPSSVHRPHVEARIRSLREAISADETQRQQMQSELAEAQSYSVFDEWWFWTIVGVVVAGGVTTTVLVLTAEDEVQPPEPGTQGAIHMVLRGP